MQDNNTITADIRKAAITNPRFHQAEEGREEMARQVREALQCINAREDERSAPGYVAPKRIRVNRANA